MVKILLPLLTLFSMLSAQISSITAEVDGREAIVSVPPQGTITITHHEQDTIDISSFRMGNQPLSVQLLKEMRINPEDPYLITLYRFQLDPYPKGLHMLDSVSAKVGDHVLTSVPSSFEVKDLKAANGQSHFLRLEAFVEGPQELYPGQRTTVFYRFSFQGNIDLLEENIPMLEANGFRRIGQKIVREGLQNNINVQEIGQLIEAITPGTFTFGPSSVKGLAYTLSPGRTKTYLRPEIVADSPEVTLKVLPFPTFNQPSAFTGAIGPHRLIVTLISPSELRLGDAITLEIAVSADGNLEGITLPDLCCLPGFSGRFDTPKAPPVGKIDGDKKVFIANFYPLSSSVTEIPPIQFAYFDPGTANYVLLQSNPIPITVSDVATPPEPLNKTTPETKLKPLEIEGNFSLDEGDLSNLWFGSWSVFQLIPFAILLLFFQYYIRSLIEKRKHLVLSMTPQELLAQANKQVDNPKVFFYYLTRALLKDLLAKGEISSIDLSPEQLPDCNHRTFLLKVQEQRYTGQPTVRQTLIDEANTLLQEVKA